ncbi:PE family protein [Mycobacterium interjectum]|nr:PE family protein [Mycobacterium interjectum]
MSYVTAAPDEVQAAARNLAGIRSMLAESTASAAAPTATWWRRPTTRSRPKSRRF